MEINVWKSTSEAHPVNFLHREISFKIFLHVVSSSYSFYILHTFNTRSQNSKSFFSLSAFTKSPKWMSNFLRMSRRRENLLKGHGHTNRCHTIGYKVLTCSVIESRWRREEQIHDSCNKQITINDNKNIWSLIMLKHVFKINS